MGQPIKDCPVYAQIEIKKSRFTNTLITKYLTIKFTLYLLIFLFASADLHLIIRRLLDI